MFKSKQTKEIERRMLIKKTVKRLNSQLEQLEQQKQSYIVSAKRAMKQGMKAQLNLAVSGLKITLAQQRRAQEMLMNFEIISQMKDMSAMTGEFLKSMGVLSKEMVRLTNMKEFEKVQADFEKAMLMTEMQADRLDSFLDLSGDSIQSADPSEISDEEVLRLVTDLVKEDEVGEDVIDKDLDEIYKRLNEKD